MIVNEPSLLPNHLTAKTAKLAVIIILIRSPIPRNWKEPVATPFE